MAYSPSTRSGHNMFDIASLLQKAIRRGDTERAGYAAYELFGSYDSLLWKRLLVVSAEDSWGVLTKEIVNLRKKHLEANKTKKGFSKDPFYASCAVDLLCKALKSRDACYFACNFIASNNHGYEAWYDRYLAQKITEAIDGDTQLNLINGFSITDKNLEASRVYHSIETFDMENTGASMKNLISIDYWYLWDVIEYASSQLTGGLLTSETKALREADEYVNRNKESEERDPLFLCKAVMNVIYFLSGKYSTVCSEERIGYNYFVDWNNADCRNISTCVLPDGTLPDYVFDVHTIRGKKMGKTDWEMNLVENDALRPFQAALFEDGSWELRYDYKHEHNMCSEKEWRMSLEYRKTHESNPAKRILQLNGT